MHHGVDRNPIIVIPWLLGSRLRDPASGQIVWGAFDGIAADPGTATGARLVALPFTEAMQIPGARVTPDGVLDRLQLRVAGIELALPAYAEILSTLGLGGYRDEALGLAGRGAEADLATLMPDVASAEERRRLALALQARLLHRARAFAAAMDQPAALPRGTELMLVAGDSMPTALRLSAASDGRLTQIASGPGDGVVLRDSVLLDERQGQDPRPPRVMSRMGFDRALFLPREHLEITRDATFRNNILFWLLEERGS